MMKSKRSIAPERCNKGTTLYGYTINRVMGYLYMSKMTCITVYFFILSINICIRSLPSSLSSQSKHISPKFCHKTTQPLSYRKFEPLFGAKRAYVSAQNTSISESSTTTSSSDTIVISNPNSQAVPFTLTSIKPNYRSSQKLSDDSGDEIAFRGNFNSHD
jgi:hypothetical protein